MAFRSEWAKYFDHGLFTIPTKGKRAFFTAFTAFADGYDRGTGESWVAKHGDENIALLCGSVLSSVNRIILAIDIDDDEMVEPVKQMLARKGKLVSKTGKKGTTFFATSEPTDKEQEIIE